MRKILDYRGPGDRKEKVRRDGRKGGGMKEGREEGEKETRQLKNLFYHYCERLLTKFSENDRHNVKSFEQYMGKF